MQIDYLPTWLGDSNFRGTESTREHLTMVRSADYYSMLFVGARRPVSTIIGLERASITNGFTGIAGAPCVEIPASARCTAEVKVDWTAECLFTASARQLAPPGSHLSQIQRQAFLKLGLSPLDGYHRVQP